MDVELKQLADELKAIQAKINQAIGSRDAILKRMKDDFGVSSLEEAKVKLTELSASIAESKLKYDKLKEEYQACQK